MQCSSSKLLAAFQSRAERNTNRSPMSTAPKGGAGRAVARPPEPCGASSGPPAPGRAKATGDGPSSISDPGAGGGGTGTGVNETPVDMTGPDDEEDNTASNYVNGKRRRGGVGARRPATSTAGATSASSSAPAPAVADTDGSSTNDVSAQPQPPVEAVPAPAAGANNKLTESRSLGPIDVDAIVFGPGGLHHDPEADERERLARKRRLHIMQQQQQQSASVAAGNGTSMSRPGLAASMSNGSAVVVAKKTSGMARNGGSNQGVVAVAEVPGITAGVTTLATAPSQSIKKASSACNSGASSSVVQIKSKATTFNKKPKSSVTVQGQSVDSSTRKAAAPTASVSHPSNVRPSITDAGTATPSNGSAPRPKGVDGTAGAVGPDKNDATVNRRTAHGDKPVETMSTGIVGTPASASIGNVKESLVAASGQAADKKESSGNSFATPAAKATSSKSKRRINPKSSMGTILRKRKPGSEYDQEAIDACCTFIQTQLMTKTCTNRINNFYSTKCTCIKTLDSALVRPAATYAATIWCGMSEEEKIDQIMKWNRDKTGHDVPYRLPIVQADDSLTETKQICRNGLAEVLGINTGLWTKVLKREKTQMEVGNNQTKSERPTIRSILKKREEGLEDDSNTIEACVEFFQSQLMKKACANFHTGVSTKCNCIKTLDPALVRPAATYAATVWSSMSKDAKINQIVEWNRNKVDGTLPFLLPTLKANGSACATKHICRNGLSEILGITYTLWREVQKKESEQKEGEGDKGKEEDDAIPVYERAEEYDAIPVYGRAVKAAIPTAAIHSSQPMVPILPAAGSWMVTGSSAGHPDVNSSVFGPMVGNPAMWAQFHAQAMASAHLATSLAQQPTAGGESSAIASQPRYDSAATADKRDEIPASDTVPRQESQSISGDKGQQSAIIPVEKSWCCDQCQHRVFHSFDEARLHEETCSGIAEAADKDATCGQHRQSASEPAKSQMSALKPPSLTSSKLTPALSTPSQGTSQGAEATKSAPNPPTNNDDVKYLCDKCKVAEFSSFADACRHESTCVGATPEGEKSPVMAFTPRKATDEEIAADAAASIEPAVLTNLATLCKQERWADIANLISANPLLSSATLSGYNNAKAGILHQVIASSGDINGRAGLVRSILTARPSAATIKNSHGSLPIHVLLQRNINMKVKLKEELLRGLIHAYPASISIAGGVGERTPLHILFTDYMSADLCRLMLTLQPEVAKMRDKKGWLPIHIACSRHCSIESLRLLIDAYPESIRKTTNDEKTPLMLARSTATKRHPNNLLIEELTKRLGAGAKAAADSKLPANQEAKSCENTAAERIPAASSSPKQEASSKKEKREPTKQEEEGVPSEPFFIGQDVWVKCGVGLQAEHEAMVVSSGKADNTKITIRWTIAGYDQTVDIGQVRPMYSAADLDKPERETSTKSTPASSVKRVGKRRSSPRPPGINQCGTCDACMVDDCGECRHCLDKPKFGGPNKSRKRCLRRPLCTVRSPGAASTKSSTAPLKPESKSSGGSIDTPTATTSASLPTTSSSGKKRSEPRRRNTYKCGTCDACMVGDCGECRHCLDKPKFGGPHNLRKSCLNRPFCTVRGSSTKDSKTPSAECGPTRSKVYTPASTSAKSTSSAAVAREYQPPDIRVGMEIMRYFAVSGGGRSYFEGKLKRLPISSSPYFFIVYSDGDKEEISELDFWNAYSDYRVQKRMLEPSEFVPESLVVANDGRLAVVHSFRPVSNGVGTTWSYRVRFDGFSAKHDEWMLEVDLRKQTPATLKWAERVREAVKKQSSGAAKKSPVGITKPPLSKQKFQPSTRPKATGKAPRDNDGHSYPLRRSGTSIDEAAPMAKRAKTSSSQESTASDTSSSIRHSRRAAAADARAAMAKTAGPKRLKKGKSSSPSKDLGNNSGTANNDTLPEIEVGTRILKYFKGGNKYYQGKITKLPGPGNSFYHIRYFDGDQEDMEPNEMWKAFSDWCVANGELTLTKFDPDQQVYAVDCLGVPREATILSFRPVEKKGSNKWTWSYLVHFKSWNSRHDDWIDEINIYKATTANKKWAEQIQEEVERRGQRGSQSNSSSRSISPNPTPSRSSAGDSRKRERAADNSKGNSYQKEGWQCDRCDEMNESNLIRCSGCSCWRDGKMPRRRGSRQDEESLREEATNDDEDSVASDVFDDGWSCPICDKQHGTDALFCSGACKGIRLCLALGCAEACEKNCDGMCSSHYQEAVEASEAIYGKDDDDDDDDGGDNNDVAMEIDNSAESVSAVSKAPNPTDETRESTNNTEVAGDDPNEESGGGAATAVVAAAAGMAGGILDNSDKISLVERSSGDSGTAHNDGNNADPISIKIPDVNDGKMPAAASSPNGPIGRRAPGESGRSNDGVDVSSPQPAAAAASTPTRPTGRTPNLKNVLAALREVDSDDEGDYDEVFGYFGAGL